MKIYHERSNAFLETRIVPIDKKAKHGETCLHRRKVNNYVEILVPKRNEDVVTYLSFQMSKDEIFSLAKRIQEIESEEPFEAVCDILPF